jgi:hypothetical protein
MLCRSKLRCMWETEVGNFEELGCEFYGDYSRSVYDCIEVYVEKYG